MSVTTFLLSLFSLTLITLVPIVKADCQSFGVDFVNGGNYFINDGSTDYFSFSSIFEGCSGEGSVTPIVIDPNENEYFCSDIPTEPEDTDQLSVCNVAGNILTKNEMISGTWTIIIEGPDFAWQRTFTITAGQQATVTTTPTVYATFNITTQYTSSINVTSTSVYNTTLTPSTVYTPASTAKQTKTVTPKPVTTTTTSVTTYTKTAHAYTIVKSTKTITAPCTSLTWKPVVDPICTIKPTITNIDSLINSLVTALPILPREQQREAARIPDKMIARNWVRLGRRAPDPSTITVSAAPVTSNVTSTSTLPATTNTGTVYTTVTSTITPPPTTIYQGTTTITTTLPTSTRTIVIHVRTTVTTTKTATATINITKTSTPVGGITPCPVKK